MKRKLSQGDISKRTGLPRTYLSRVENSHTIPSLATIEKMAHAFEIPVYRIFYQGNGRPRQARKLGSASPGRRQRAKEEALLAPFLPLLVRLSDRDRKLLFRTAKRIVFQRRGRRKRQSLAR